MMAGLSGEVAYAEDNITITPSGKLVIGDELRSELRETYADDEINGGIDCTLAAMGTDRTKVKIVQQLRRQCSFKRENNKKLNASRGQAPERHSNDEIHQPDPLGAGHHHQGRRGGPAQNPMPKMLGRAKAQARSLSQRQDRRTRGSVASATTTDATTTGANSMTGMLSEEHEKWLEARGFDLETVTRYGLYTEQAMPGWARCSPFPIAATVR